MIVKSSLSVVKKQKMFARMFLLIGLFILTTNIFAQDPDFYIYLCFGQSNMEGQATIEVIDMTVDSSFKVMACVNCSNPARTKYSWYTAVPPLCRCKTGSYPAGLCPADYFGKTMVLNLPSNIRVGVVNVSVAGCKIELFDKDNYLSYLATAEEWVVNISNNFYNGNPYGYLVDVADSAQQDGVIKGILLHQGESNTDDNLWPSKVKKVYNDLINDLGLNADSIPLLAGEVLYADQGGQCASMNSIIARLPDTLPNSYVISSSGCPGMDQWHFNSAGYRELGIRYAKTMLSIMGYDTTNLQYPEVGAVDLKEVPEGYILGQNFPNPFSTTTSIKYYLPQKARVTLEVLDVTGRTVETLIDNAECIGEHTITYDGSGLSSGIYLYRLGTSIGFTQSKKMLLLKQ
jgi:hypothetical protein